MSEFHEKARPHVEAVLEPGEELRGFVAATQRSMFSGRLVALAASDRRLILVPLDRRIERKGEPIALTPDSIAAASAGGGGGWGTEPGAAVMDAAAAELKIRTVDGEKLKLMMMRGEGPGPLARLGGGEDQRRGMQAIADWFAAAGR